MPQESKRPGRTGDNAQLDKEEITFLRQKFSSMMMRGLYKECFKLIEDNFRLLYFKERWPENFLASLRIHKKAYPATEHSQPYEEYLTALLQKYKIPTVFVSFLRGSDSAIVWSADFFRDLAIVAMGKEDYEDALGYCDLLLKIDPLNSNGYVLKGWVHTDLEQFQEAQAAYEQALERNRSNHQAWYSLAQLHAERDTKQALECIKTALEYAPDDARYHGLMGKILVNAGNRRDALSCYEQATRLDPVNAQYYYDTGEILLVEGQKIAAMRQYSSAVSNNERHIPSLLRLAELFAETQPDTALPYINTVCTEQPKNLDAALLRAELLYRTGNYGGAEKQYKAVLELDSSYAKAYGAMGKINLEDNPAASLVYFGKAAELDKAEADYPFGKAQALQALGRTQEAVAEYQAAVKLNKNLSKAWGALGLLYLKEKPTTAIEYLDKAIALESNNAEYYRAKAEALLASGKGAAQAAECYDLAVKYDPGNAVLQLRLAQLLEEVANYASAQEHYRQAASLDPHNAPAFYGVAKMILRESPETALIYINTAIHLDANNGAYYYLKAKILNRLEDPEKSLELLQKAYDKDSHNTELMEELSLMLSGQSLRVALLYINRAIEYEPESCRFLCGRAKILLSLGETQKALSQYRQVIEIDANYHKAYYGVGLLLMDKDEKKALEHFERAIVLEPAEARYHSAKARILARNPDTYKQALDSYENAIERDKSDWQVILEKAQLLDGNGEVLSAQQYYRRALLANRDCLEATARMGQVLSEHGSIAGLGYLEHAIELDPENSSYYVWKAQLHLFLEQNELAEQCCRDAIAFGAEDENVYATLAGVLRWKLPETALKYINAAIELNPANPAHYLLRGDIHRTLGEWEAAKEMYRKVLELSPANDEAMAKMARILRRDGSQESLAFIDAALEKSPDNPDYLHIKARIMEDVFEDRVEAIACISLAVKAEPDSVRHRELLVGLLQRNRSKVMLALERMRLERCKKKAQKLEEAFLQLGGIPEKPEEEPEASPTQEEALEQPEAVDAADGALPPIPVSQSEEKPQRPLEEVGAVSGVEQ